ncbi:MAG: GGDEF domain-containing protein [Synergistaceae bacterium]|nr:GGDEF domain-containing protein [Synergistaceae bacterium]
MDRRREARRSFTEKELPFLRLLSVITAVWFAASGAADLVMGYPLPAVLDFFMALLFLFFRLRMHSMPPSAVRSFAPPILLFLNLLPLFGGFLETGFYTLLVRHLVTLLGTGLFLQYRDIKVFNTYLLINALSFAGVFLQSGNFEGEAVNLAICYVFIVSGMYFFNALHRKTSGRLAALADAERRARLMASRDGLTGLYNRRRFDEEFTRLLAEGTDVSLILIDLDDFKSINDSRGHAAGDEGLKDTAAAIAGAVRKNDVPCRVGGDEFAVLLPSCPEEMGRRIAENICRRVRSKVPLAGLSIGVAFAPGGGTPRDAFKRADEALYSAKAGGKGRIVTCSELLQKEGEAQAAPCPHEKEKAPGPAGTFN